MVQSHHPSLFTCFDFETPPGWYLKHQCYADDKLRNERPGYFLGKVVAKHNTLGSMNI